MRLTISPSIIHVMVDEERPQTALEEQGGGLSLIQQEDRERSWRRHEPQGTEFSSQSKTQPSSWTAQLCVAT